MIYNFFTHNLLTWGKEANLAIRGTTRYQQLNIIYLNVDVGLDLYQLFVKSVSSWPSRAALHELSVIKSLDWIYNLPNILFMVRKPLLSAPPSSRGPLLFLVILLLPLHVRHSKKWHGTRKGKTSAQLPSSPPGVSFLLLLRCYSSEGGCGS